MLSARTFKLALSAAALTLPMLAHADAAQDAVIKELVEIAHLDSLLPSLVQQTSGSAVPLLQEYFVKNKISLSAEQQKKVQAGLKPYVERQRKLASDYFASAAAKQQFQSAINKAYSSQFSTDELKQIVAFYKTSAGQKLMKQQAKIVNGVATEMLKSADKSLLPKMQAAAVEYGKNARK